MATVTGTGSPLLERTPKAFPSSFTSFLKLSGSILVLPSGATTPAYRGPLVEGLSGELEALLSPPAATAYEGVSSPAARCLAGCAALPGLRSRGRLEPTWAMGGGCCRCSSCWWASLSLFAFFLRRFLVS